MEHRYEVAGPRFRLRPVRREDSAFIVELRSDPERTRHLHRISGGLEGQERWYEEYRSRQGDYYFVVEDLRTGDREGLVGLYDVDAGGAEGEWGRWITREDSQAGYESAFLILDFAFRVLDLSSVYCRTMMENVRVVSFHDHFGFTGRRDLPTPTVVDGTPCKMVEHRMDRETWGSVAAGHRARLERLARR